MHKKLCDYLTEIDIRRPRNPLRLLRPRHFQLRFPPSPPQLRSSSDDPNSGLKQKKEKKKNQEERELIRELLAKPANRREIVAIGWRRRAKRGDWIRGSGGFPVHLFFSFGRDWKNCERVRRDALETLLEMHGGDFRGASERRGWRHRVRGTWRRLRAWSYPRCVGPAFFPVAGYKKPKGPMANPPPAWTKTCMFPLAYIGTIMEKLVNLSD